MMDDVQLLIIKGEIKEEHCKLTAEMTCLPLLQSQHVISSCKLQFAFYLLFRSYLAFNETLCFCFCNPRRSMDPCDMPHSIIYIKYELY